MRDHKNQRSTNRDHVLHRTRRQSVEEYKFSGRRTQHDKTRRASESPSSESSSSESPYSRYMALDHDSNFVHVEDAKMPTKLLVGLPELKRSFCDWYKVVIRGGKFYSQASISQAILNAISPAEFVPLYWGIESDSKVFYVNNYKTAQILQQIVHRIKFHDGQHAYVQVLGGMPDIPINDELRKILHHAMRKRYGAWSGVLDLARFHTDPDFSEMCVMLSRDKILLEVLKIVAMHMPTLTALNLSENQISSLAAFNFVELPNLSILYLNDNNIPLRNMEPIQKFPLKSLQLMRNPALVCRYQKYDEYEKEMRRTFPTLLRLDGFDLRSACRLPDSRPLYICDGGNFEVVQAIYKDYYTRFDSNRAQLHTTYADGAIMSLIFPTVDVCGKPNSIMQKFAKTENEGANKIHVGADAIVEALVKWPRTEHILESFTIDLTFSTLKMMIITVGGLFKAYEADTKENADLHRFEREWVIVCNNEGFCKITNELTYIGSATNDQNLVQPPKKQHERCVWDL